jgi:hypothetical protein
LFVTRDHTVAAVGNEYSSTVRTREGSSRDRAASEEGAREGRRRKVRV